MGYINLAIKKDGETKPYIVFSAEYLNEAWLAEVYEDGTTKIIKQFKCRKFKKCFYDLSEVVETLGTVVTLKGNDIEPRYVNMLENILINKSHKVPKRKIPVISLSFRRPSLYNLSLWNQTFGNGFA